MLKNVNFSYDYSDNQENLYSNYHERYTCSFEYNGKSLDVDFECGENNCPDLYNVLSCIIGDRNAYINATDVADFLTEFGYIENAEGIRQGLQAYNGCKETAEKLEQVFSLDELATLEKELTSMGLYC